MDLSLGRMQAALALTGSPNFPIIQVLGTNGKGSTSAYLASLAQAHGLKAGLYTSPHFISIKERIHTNAHQLADTDWLDAINELSTIAPDLLSDLTYFELLTILAVIIFRNAKVDVAIFEAGLGGQHDATTALGAHWHCFAPIAMDHANVLGPSLAAIAVDKAAAISRHGHVFSVRQYPIAMAALKSEAKHKNASLKICEPLPSATCLGLKGNTQFTNAGLALTCWRAFAAENNIMSKHGAEMTGLGHAFLPGRLQIVRHPVYGTPLILDGAHNPHAMLALLRQLPFEPQTIIFSALADKDWHVTLGMLTHKLPNAKVFIPQLGNSRAADAAEMTAWSGSNAKIFTGADSVGQAILAARGSVLLCGSLYLLAEFYKNYPQFLEQREANI